MKKTAIICVVIILYTSIIWGEEHKIIEIKPSDDPTEIGYHFDKINYFDGDKKVYFIDGYNFAGYEKTDPNLFDINTAQLDFIQKKTQYHIQYWVTARAGLQLWVTCQH